MSDYKHPIKKYPQYYPIIDENSRLLILGSFPSKDWASGGFYYGSDRNRFWHLIVRFFHDGFKNKYSSLNKSQIINGSEIDAYVSDMMPEQKAQLLLNNNLALWDIIDECNSKTKEHPSKDTDIIDPIFNDILDLLKRYEGIQKVLFTGSGCLKKKMAENIKSAILKKEIRRDIDVGFLPAPARVIWRGGNIEKWRELLTQDA